MVQSHAKTNHIDSTQLRALLAKAKSNPTFRDSLIGSPEATLRAEGLRPDSHWVHFFGELHASDFEKQINTQIIIQTGEGRG
jgi:hypothetical protein